MTDEDDHEETAMLLNILHDTQQLGKMMKDPNVTDSELAKAAVGMADVHMKIVKTKIDEIEAAKVEKKISEKDEK